jgi:hypothetical protein
MLSLLGLDSIEKKSSETTNGKMKENNGRAAKHRRNYRVFGVISITIFVLGVVSFLDSGKRGNKLRRKKRHAGSRKKLPLRLADDDGNDNRAAKSKKQQDPPPSTYQRVNHKYGGDDDTADHEVDDRAAKRNSRHDGSQAGEGASGITKEEKLVLSGQASLIDIRVVRGSLDKGSNQYGPGVNGVFCHINWDLHKQDPPTYPMFKDLSESSKCDSPKNQFHLSLRDIAHKARKMDDVIQQGKGNAKVNDVHTLPLQGVVFHESRCGSTLVANAMAASDPASHRVYSESPPPITAFKACDQSGASTCSKELRNQLIQDTLYLMGRSNDPNEKYLFLKIQSIGSTMVSAFRSAMPDIPWIFVYRDPVPVMMSHLDMPAKRIPQSNCLRSFHRPSPEYKALIKKFSSGERFNDLSNEQHCAAHLATIVETVKDEQLNHPSEAHKGVMVNYGDLPGLLISDIFPRHFDLTMTQDMTDNIQRVCGTYSKARNANPKAQKGGVVDSVTGKWKSDTERKEKLATPAVREAAAQFLQPSFDWMQAQRQAYLDASPAARGGGGGGALA